MTTIITVSLRHKKLVVLLWVLAGAGALTQATAVRHMTYSYATPGQPGYQANEHLMARFRIDPTIEPTIALLHLPPGESMRTPRGRAIAARTFAAPHGRGSWPWRITRPRATRGSSPTTAEPPGH